MKTMPLDARGIDLQHPSQKKLLLTYKNLINMHSCILQ